MLTRLSEAGDDAILSGALAAPFFGPIFDRLLSKRVLVEQAPLADWDVCDTCECGLPCRPIRKAGDAFRAECPLDVGEDMVLGAEDLRRFRISPEGLLGYLIEGSGLSEAPEEMAPGVWTIGTLPSGRTVAACFGPHALV